MSDAPRDGQTAVGGRLHVLVTGGAGFIGSHVVVHLVRLGHRVRVLDLLHRAAHQGPPGYLNGRAEYRWGDLRDEETVTAAVQDVDAVSHQAAMVGLGRDFGDVRDYVAHNCAGTAALLWALARPRFRGRLVLGGSMVVYGEGRYRCAEHGDVRAAPREEARLAAHDFEPSCPVCGQPLTPVPVPEDTPPDPRNVYAATKLHQEQLCAAFARESGAELAVLRYHNVYGPRMPRDTPYAGVASMFRSAIASGRAPEVFEDGGQLRDFIHVDDVARANVLALTVPRFGDTVFNIASGHPRTVLDLARTMSAAFESGAAPHVTGAYRMGDVRHVFASTRRARDHLGFEASVPFDVGVRAFAHAPLRSPAADVTNLPAGVRP